MHSHLKLRFDGKGATLREGVSRRSGKHIYAAGMLWGRLAICAKTAKPGRNPLSRPSQDLVPMRPVPVPNHRTRRWLAIGPGIV